MGAYKRTPVAVTEREVGVPPIDLYIKFSRLRRAIRIQDTPMAKDIKRAMD
jgi:hypothetical protein